MIFIDKIKIKILSGKSGKGKISFFKKKNKLIPSGGPGGESGNIYINFNKKLDNLNYFFKKRFFKSSKGFDGKSNFRKGKSGKDLVINLPEGTLIKNLNNNKIIFNLNYFKKNIILLLKGNEGEIGNSNKSFNKKNKYKLNSEKDFIELQLDLNIFSHIILIGYPNTGKSTFINFISNSKFKTGNYNFTTLIPQKSILNFNFKKKIIILDLPGIIKNSYNNIGLGLKFLKHIYFNKIIIFFINFSKYFVNYINIISNELYKYNKYYFYKPVIFFFNKLDLFLNNFSLINYKKNLNLINFFYYKFFLSSKKKFFYKKIFFIIYKNILL